MWNTDVGYVEELQNRGFPANLDVNEHYKHGKHYRFFKDGKRLYLALKKYTGAVVKSCFSSDDEVKNDGYLQLFYEQISSKSLGDLSGFPSAPSTIEGLINDLTKIVW